MEKVYIGTKVIAAIPMNEAEFLMTFKGQKLNEGQVDREGYRVRYEDGYISWSPKETFERAYREMTIREAALLSMAN